MKGDDAWLALTSRANLPRTVSPIEERKSKESGVETILPSYSPQRRRRCQDPGRKTNEARRALAEISTNAERGGLERTERTSWAAEAGARHASPSLETIHRGLGPSPAPPDETPEWPVAGGDASEANRGTSAIECRVGGNAMVNKAAKRFNCKHQRR